MSNTYDVNGLDPEDIGLQGIFGDRFVDATKEPQKPQTASKPNNTPNEAKTAQKAADKPRKAKDVDDLPDWNPPKPEPDFMDRLKGCAMHLIPCACLSVIFFYWQQTGQMLPSAAVPSLCACAACGGWSIGKFFARGDR